MAHTSNDQPDFAASEQPSLPEDTHAGGESRVIPDHERLVAGMTRLHTVSTALSGALGVLEVAKIMVTQGVESLGADAGLVAMLDTRRAQLRIVDAHGYKPQLLAAQAQIELAQASALTEAVVKRSPIWSTIEEQQNKHPHTQVLLLSSEFQARAALPLLVGEQTLGVLQLNFRAGHRFDSIERQIVEALAAVGAQALERAQLYDRQQRSLQRLTTLQHIDRGVLEGESAREIIGRALDDVQKLVPYQFIVISFQNASQEAPAVVAHRDLRSSSPGRTMQPLDPAEVPANAQHGQPLLLHDLAALNPRSTQVARLLAAGLRSQMSVPMLAKNLRIGQIDVLGERPNIFTDDDRQVISEVASQIAIVLEHMNLIAERAQAQERWQHMVEISPHGLLMVDTRGRLLLANAEIERMFGYERDELLGEPVERLIPERFHGSHERYCQHFEAHATVYMMGAGRELFGRRKDGSEFPVEIRLNMFPDGENLYTLAAVVDITERRRNELARYEAEQKLQALVELLPVGISILNAERQPVYANQALERILRLPKEALDRGEHLKRQYIQPDGSTMPINEIASARVLSEQRPVYNAETGIVCSDGAVIWTAVSAAPVNIGDWNQVVVTSDITERKKAEAAVHAAEERLRVLTETMPAVPWTATPEGLIDYFSQRWLDLTGLSREEALDDGWQRVPHPDDLEEMNNAWTHSVATGEDFDIIHRIRTADGSYRWQRSRAQAQYDDHASIVRWHGVTYDIHDLQITEAALRESEGRFRQLAEGLPQLVWTADAYGLRDYLSRQWQAYTGRKERAGLDNNWRALIHRDDYHRVVEVWEQSLRSQTDFREQYRLRRYDGTYRWFDSHAVPLRDDNNRVVRWFGTDSDIEMFKRNQETLREYADELQRLSRRLVEVQEAERFSIARELHDQVGQSLTGLKLLFESARTMKGNALALHLGEASRLINELLGRVRNLSLDLRPSMLDDLGLLPALKWLIDRYTLQTGIQVQWWHQGIDRRFPTNIEISVYRVVQEALTNTARHAEVQLVEVRIMADDEQLLVQVDDEGKGFNVEEMRRAGKSMGLLGMHERAVLLGGTLLLESQPGQGAHLSVTFPLAASMSEE